MYDPRSVKDFSMRYCPDLGDGVVVMTEQSVGMPEHKTCLSSHLCHADTRMLCRHTAPVPVKRDTDILNL